MEDPRKLRALAGWYREFAERAGNPAIWEARLRTAKDLEREADRLEKTAARRREIAQPVAEKDRESMPNRRSKPGSETEECIMKFDSLSPDAVRQVDLVANKPGIPIVAPLTPRLKHRLVAGAAAAVLAFAVGLLVAVFGAWAADELAQPRPTAERAGRDIVCVQPTAKQFSLPNQPGVSAGDASYIDQLYRQLIGPPPTNSSGSRSSSRLRAAPNDDAAGSVRR